MCTDEADAGDAGVADREARLLVRLRASRHLSEDGENCAVEEGSGVSDVEDLADALDVLRGGEAGHALLEVRRLHVAAEHRGGDEGGGVGAERRVRGPRSRCERSASARPPRPAPQLLDFARIRGATWIVLLARNRGTVCHMDRP